MLKQALLRLSKLFNNTTIEDKDCSSNIFFKYPFLLLAHIIRIQFGVITTFLAQKIRQEKLIKILSYIKSLCIIFCVKIPTYSQRWKQSSDFKWLLETLLLATKMYTNFTADVIWVNAEVCSVTSKPTQSSSRRVSSFKDSPVLLTTEW